MRLQRFHCPSILTFGYTLSFLKLLIEFILLLRDIVWKSSLASRVIFWYTQSSGGPGRSYSQSLELLHHQRYGGIRLENSSKSLTGFGHLLTVAFTLFIVLL